MDFYLLPKGINTLNVCFYFFIIIFQDFNIFYLVLNIPYYENILGKSEVKTFELPTLF